MDRPFAPKYGTVSQVLQVICDVTAGGLGKEILMPYPINQRAHQFNSIQSVPISFGLWDTALKFLSPGPRSDVTDHLAIATEWNKDFEMAINFLPPFESSCPI